MGEWVKMIPGLRISENVVRKVEDSPRPKRRIEVCNVVQEPELELREYVKPTIELIEDSNFVEDLISDIKPVENVEVEIVEVEIVEVENVQDEPKITLELSKDDANMFCLDVGVEITGEIKENLIENDVSNYIHDKKDSGERQTFNNREKGNTKYKGKK